MDLPEILECPFCGNKGELRRVWTTNGCVSFQAYSVRCVACGASTRKFADGMDVSRFNGVMAWNLRANKEK